MKKSFLLLLLFLSVSSSFADDGRYQIRILQQGGRTDNHGKVFIMDSQQGHMWTWEDKSKFTRKDGKIAFGTKLTYQGKLEIGMETGEIVGYSK